MDTTNSSALSARPGQMVHPLGIELGGSGRVMRAADPECQDKTPRLLSVEKTKDYLGIQHFIANGLNLSFWFGTISPGFPIKM